MSEGYLLVVERLREEVESLRCDMAGWVRANAPGGWIDNLRAALRELVEAVEGSHRTDGIIKDQGVYCADCHKTLPLHYPDCFTANALSRAKEVLGGND